jgi:hypothetical protein
MNLRQIAETTGLRIFCNEAHLDRDCTGGYASDLLSDVMGHAGAGVIWITLQTHKNVIAIASLKELACVVLVKNLVPDPDMLAQAITEGIPVLGSSEGTFEVCGKIFELMQKQAMHDC